MKSLNSNVLSPGSSIPSSNSLKGRKRKHADFIKSGGSSSSCPSSASPIKKRRLNKGLAKNDKKAQDFSLATICETLEKYDNKPEIILEPINEITDKKEAPEFTLNEFEVPVIKVPFKRFKTLGDQFET